MFSSAWLNSASAPAYLPCADLLTLASPSDREGALAKEGIGYGFGVRNALEALNHATVIAAVLGKPEEIAQFIPR